MLFAMLCYATATVYSNDMLICWVENNKRDTNKSMI